MTDKKITFISSETKQASEAREKLVALYGNSELSKADIIVALGGDGLMLQVLHQFIDTEIPIYGINCGSVGFLMNELNYDELLNKIKDSEITTINPLKMTVTDINNDKHTEMQLMK